MAVNNVPFYGDDPFGVGQAPVTPDFGSFQTVGNGKLMVVVFVVDASRSMRGDRIAAVNAALTELMYELKQIQSDNGLDMKISIMTFTSDAKWVLQNVPVDEVLLRTIDTRVGLTNYGGAFKELNLVLTKDRFMAHTGKVAPPAIMFMTDGEPCDDYQHDLEILLKNGWFANANRSAVLIGDAINNPNARIAVEQFVENANEDIVTAEDSSTIVHRLKLATLHTVAGTPAVDGNTSAAKGGAAGGQAPSFDPANNPFIDGGNPAVATPPDPNDPFLGGGNTGGSKDPFGDPFGDAASAGGNSTGGSSVDPFADPFGGAAASTGTSSSSGSSADPFADPFADSFGAAAASTGTSSSSGSSADPFASAGGSSADPFVSAGGNSADPFASAGGSDADPFGGAFGKGSGSADASSISSGSASSSNDPFASAGGSGADPFGGVSGKGSGSADASSTSSGSASSSNDPFASAGGSGADPFGGGGADPFGGSGGDPFGNGGGDPFGGGGDPFGGSDPFGGF